MNDLNLQKELLLKIVSTKIQGLYLTVMGGAATDTILGRTCNDIDIFIPRFIVDSVGVSLDTLLEKWGVTLDRFDEYSIKHIESKYGDSTLVYDIRGQYKTSPAKIQFIAVEAYPDGSSYHGQEHFIENTFSSFGVSTSCSAAFLTKYNQLGVYSTGIGRYADRLRIDKMLYREGSEKLLAKSVDKYIKYCERGFEKIPDGNSILFTGMRCLLSSVNGNLVATPTSLFTMLNHEEYVSAPEEIDYTVSNNSPAEAAPIAPPAPSVPGVWFTPPPITSGAGSRPFDWDGASRAAQELQSARSQDERFIQEIRGEPITRSNINELINTVARTTPSVSTPRPPDEF